MKAGPPLKEKKIGLFTPSVASGGTRRITLYFSICYQQNKVIQIKLFRVLNIHIFDNYATTREKKYTHHFYRR